MGSHVVPIIQVNDISYFHQPTNYFIYLCCNKDTEKYLKVSREEEM